MHQPQHDRVSLRQLSLDMSIGILPHERTATQPVTLDVHCFLPLAPAASQQRLDLSVDYAALATALRQLAASRHWDLIETFAEHAAALALSLGPVHSVEITAAKPRAVPGALAEISLHRHAPAR